MSKRNTNIMNVIILHNDCNRNSNNNNNNNDNHDKQQ